MKTDIIEGSFYLKDNSYFECDSINNHFETTGYQLYEVMRTRGNTLLFATDHLKRMQDGIVRLGKPHRIDFPSVLRDLETLIVKNNNRQGNIKVYLSLRAPEIKLSAAYIPHAYPTEEMKRSGISLTLLTAERDKPLIKQIAVSESIRRSINLKTADTHYEALLVDHEGNVTEGSRSNFFLIRGASIFSAPEEDILPGITRKYVLELAKKKGIALQTGKVPSHTLSNFDAAFICGTSPGILPVRAIDRVLYNTSNSTLRGLMKAFDNFLEYVP